MTFTQRKELAEQVDIWIKDNDVQYCTFAVITYLDMKELIEKRKKGRWIIDKDCEGKTRTVTCNLCGHEEFNWHDPNYCPNCGAEMRDES